MRIRLKWWFLLILLGFSQKIAESVSPIRFIVPISLDKGTIQSLTFITKTTALTVYNTPSDVDTVTITDVTFYFSSVDSKGRTFPITPELLQKTYRRPLLILHRINKHLHEIQYIITPMPLNFESISKQRYYFYSIDIEYTGNCDIVKNKIDVSNGHLYARSDTVVRIFDLGGPATGTDHNQNEGLIGLMLTTKCNQNGNYDILDPRLPHFGVKEIVDMEANIDAKNHNNYISSPKFLVPFDINLDGRKRCSVFVHQKVAVTKHPDMDLGVIQSMTFYFNILNEAVSLRIIDMIDLGISDQGPILIIVFSTNIVETEAVLSINVHVGHLKANTDTFYLCGGDGKLSPTTICEFIEKMDLFGNFKNSKLQRTVEDLESVVVYTYNDDTVILAGITAQLNIDYPDMLKATLVSDYRKMFNDFIAFVTSKPTIGHDNSDIRRVKKFVTQFKKTSPVRESLLTIYKLKKYLKDLKIIPNCGLYLCVNKMVAWLDEVAELGKPLTSPSDKQLRFDIPHQIVERIKPILKDMKRFLFPDLKI